MVERVSHSRNSIACFCQASGDHSRTLARPVTDETIAFTGLWMSRQAVGNALAGVAFLVIAVVDFTRDSSGIGVVFLVFAAVFFGLAASATRT
jgi:hypothetical protein